MNEKELRNEIEALRREFAQFGTETPLPRSGQVERKARAEKDVVFFGETYFPHRVRKPQGSNELITSEHYEMLRVADIKNVPKLILMYRGSAKTTWITIIDTLHKLYFQKFQAGVIGSYDAKTAVNNFMSGIFMELVTNPRLSQDFGQLEGETRWGVSDFITRSGIRLAVRAINEMVKGFNNPVNGARLDLFRGDDLQKRESARSVKQVNNLMNWLWEEVFLALRDEVDGGSYFDILGTCVDGGTDAMTQMKNDNIRAMLKLIVPMSLDFPSELIDTRDEYHKKNTHISEATGLPQWPARYVLDKAANSKDNRTSIAEKRRGAGNSRHAAENQQHPLSATHKTFRVEEWTHYLEPYGKIPVPDWSTHSQIIGRCDPSNTIGGTRKAIIVLSSSPDDWRIYVRHVFLQQCSIDDLFKALLDIRFLYGSQVGIEDTGPKEWLWRDVRTFEETRQVDLNLYPIHTSTNKQGRISGSLQSPWQRGIFVFQKGHSDQDILLEEGDLYPEGPFCDGLDAFAGGYDDISLLKYMEATTQQKQHQSSGVLRPIKPVSIGTVLQGRI